MLCTRARAAFLPQSLVASGLLGGLRLEVSLSGCGALSASGFKSTGSQGAGTGFRGWPTLKPKTVTLKPYAGCRRYHERQLTANAGVVSTSTHDAVAGRAQRGTGRSDVMRCAGGVGWGGRHAGLQHSRRVRGPDCYSLLLSAGVASPPPPPMCRGARGGAPARGSCIMVMVTVHYFPASDSHTGCCVVANILSNDSWATCTWRTSANE